MDLLRFIKSVLLVFALFFIMQAQGTTLLNMNAENLVDNSKMIFRGEVINMQPTSIKVGGGEVAAITYTIAVSEPLKGDFDMVKGQAIATFTMVGLMDSKNQAKRMLPGFPKLNQGEDYLLFVGQESSVGLSLTVGAAQGAFVIKNLNGAEKAINGFNNRGLFTNVARAANLDESSVDYAQLKSLIQSIIAKPEGELR